MVLSGRGVRLGLYQAGTHNVKPIPDCVVHHPCVNQAVGEIASHGGCYGNNRADCPQVAAIERATAEANIVAFDEFQREGMLRYVQLSVERHTGTIQVLSQRSSRPPDDLSCVSDYGNTFL